MIKTICMITGILFISSQAGAARISFDGNHLASGWKKHAAYIVKHIFNGTGSLVIEGREPSPDADSINIGTVFNTDNDRKKFLVITIENIKGDFQWGGKVMGLSFSPTKIPNYDVGNTNATFIAPAGYSMDDNYINASFYQGMKLYYDISNLGDIIQLGAKTYVYQGTLVEISFDFSDTIN
ncbi:hypothetical protein [Desulfocicer vacuolatum]|nr:hypothetical protein [Desulfocicer vacuolatum]